MKQILTGFLDQEGSISFSEQLKLAQKHHIDHIALRYYNQKPLIEISEKEIKEMQNDLKDAKMRVSMIDTLTKGYDINSDAKQKEALDEFKYMVKIADKFKTNYLILRLPKFNDVMKEFDLIKKCMHPFIDFANKKGKKILLMPDQGYKANTYAYLFKKLKSNNLYFLFDPVYFLDIHESSTTAYRLLKKKIEAFACHDQDHQSIPKLIGYGKTDIVSIFKKLIRDNFSGFLLIDNKFYKAVFEEPEKKEGFFKKMFSNAKKKKEAQKDELSKKIFPNEETKNVTYDDILDNQIKVLHIIFKK
ncbi:MAG: sugar phosphate isomerase/epimerase [Acholeplasmataceae bacterium]|nr:sugar phosphate isomerase/epimerase [Acholeplasmataceae bacterium]